ncbi:MAG: hypothetical protein DPW18_14530 [Chloroflexi bacterium]|nr:hypothetical protein [Chloroflexota bacterium]MDL1941654.1 hypothetical protein [Chloroflexi bacterium CFX2]
MPKPETRVSIKVTRSIDDINPADWDALSNDMPFQSHAWYRFGEKVMDDCEPVYVLAYRGNRLAGRASFWVIRSEPIPQYAGRWRAILKMVFSRYPLLICRSPLSNTSGVVIPSGEQERGEVLSKMIAAAFEMGRRRKCSLLLLDYLGKDPVFTRSLALSVMEVSNPGMSMKNRWDSFDGYLAGGGKKDRQHYKRTLREAEKLNIKLAHSGCVENVDEVLPLIRSVERQHGAPANPWIRSMLLNMQMVNGVFLTAVKDGKTVGCGLLLEDNNAQMAAALGLDSQVPYVYLMLVYEGIKTALERKNRLMRWGSGAYDVKRRLGFEPEDNALLAFAPVHPALRKLASLFARSG